MALEFKLQDPGEGIHEAEIREVLVSAGDEVEEGQDVLVVETDKAAVEISSPYSGTVREVNFEIGDTAHVGDVLITFENGDAAGGDTRQQDTNDGKGGKRTEGKKKDEQKARNGGDGEKKADRESGRGKSGNGKQRSDEGASSGRKKPVLATPATRRLAKELGVDLRQIDGSGQDGRITKEDVRARAGDGGKRQEEAGPKGDGAPSLPDFEKWGAVERVPLRSVRRTVARRMATSWQRIPHVTHQDKVDISDIEAFRRRHADDGRMEGKLTLTAIILKALAATLKEHSRFNASLDEEAEEIVLKKHYHLGVAVDTDHGLMVPVVRDVDRKSLAQIATEVEAVAERARSGKADRDDLSGGTFTLTNIGGLGGVGFSPMINYPEVAILGLARAALEPVVMGDMDDNEIVPRLMLPTCLAFDHRVIDGADAARFTNTLKDALSDAEQLALVA